MRGFRLLLGLLIPVAIAVAGYLWLRQPPVRTNVVVITVDTLRANHLGAYGYERATSPTLDTWASSGVIFDNAFSNATLSGPSHATMMTSLHVPVHGAVNNAVELADGQLTVAEVFRSAGYETAFFASHPFVGGFGLEQGFDVAETHTVPSHGVDHPHEDKVKRREPLSAVFDATVEWLSRPHTKPFFVWLHIQHVHSSYEPPPPFDTMFTGGPPESEHELRCLYTTNDHEDEKIDLTPAELDYIVAQYDGEIAYVDTQLERVFSQMEAFGLNENTLTVLTADHGEMLFSDPKRRFASHGRRRSDAVLQVPLIVRGPNVPGAGERIQAMVSLMDLAPTIVDLAGLHVPSRFDGSSLVPLMQGKVDTVRDITFSVTFHSDDVMRLSARSSRIKLICDRTPNEMTCAVHDLESDPLEQTDVAGDPAYGKESGALLVELEQWFVKSMIRAVKQKVEPRSDEALDLLRRAGYLRPEEH